MKNIHVFDGSLIPTKYNYTAKDMFEGIELYVIPSFRIPAAIGYRISSKGPVKVIIVNNKFTKLSHEQQLFVLYHELGHYKCGHLDRSRNGRNIELEVEADIYALNRLAKEFNSCPSIMINVFMDTMTTLGLINNREVHGRVRAMESYYGV